MTTIHTRQLQQYTRSANNNYTQGNYNNYTQGNYNNTHGQPTTITHKTTTTIHTRQQQQYTQDNNRQKTTTTIHTRQLTIHTRQQQQYIQNNNNNRHKTTTTIHTRQLKYTRKERSVGGFLAGVWKMRRIGKKLYKEICRYIWLKRALNIYIYIYTMYTSHSKIC